MRNLRKSAGVDGMPAEFLKEACLRDRGVGAGHEVLAAVVALLTKVFGEGYPDRWTVGVVCPVPKKPTAVEKDDPRGIVVGTALARLYSLLLLGRLDKWAERYQVRAAGQFGFRTERGTVDRKFMLQHLVVSCGSR